jgi:hypothetical protein
MSRHSAPALSAGQDLVEPLVWVADAAYRAGRWLWGAEWDRPPAAVIGALRFGILQALFFLALMAT